MDLKKLKHVSLKIKDQIAVVTFDDQDDKVNTLSSKLFDEISTIFDHIESNPELKAVVLISGKPDCFIAGADIKELQSQTSAEGIEAMSKMGQDFLNRVSESKKPVVAAINGSCMGGGLEVALACHYRIATDHGKTQLSLPEVMLGLLPGAGGTQRLPRLIGVQKALDLILTGKVVRPEKAKKLGLVDHVTVAGDGLESTAIEAAKRLVDGTLKSFHHDAQFQEKFLEDTFVGRKILFTQARTLVKTQTGGHYPAPLGILDVIEKGLEKGLKSGLEYERKRFGELSQTNVSKALINIFFAQNNLKKNRFGKPEHPANTVAVLGAGLMGAGIGLVSIQKGMHVLLKDISQESLQKGKRMVWDEMDKKVKRGAMLPVKRDQTMANLNTQVDYHHFDKCEIVIEAVFEDLQLKQRVLNEVEAVISPHCVFASNTSALPITDIAKASKRPENVIGMHYFSPVHKMPLLEIITTEKTSKETAALAVDVGLRQGKTVIVVGDGPGFYTTRILAPFMDEVAVLALEGMDFHRIDQAMLRFGCPVGPVTLMDEVGIDVAAHVAKQLSEAFGERMTGSNPAAFNDFMEQKIMGRKSGQGFYLYESKKGNPLKQVQTMFAKVTGKSKSSKPVNPKAVSIVRKYAKASTSAKAGIEEIQDRIILRMVNEAAFCLQEGILKDPVDGDIGAIFGLGFPPFLGGPFRYMDKLGIENVVEKLNKLRDQYGVRFDAAPILVDNAKKGIKFYKD
ncbi:fatty acid oxidation complex subunit alpha FadJ [Deltaproteobacteria bacterium TL4]